MGVIYWARLMVSRAAVSTGDRRPLYAGAILEEISSPGHQLMKHDVDYRRRLFRRYAELLRKDMDQLRGLGFSPSRYFWYTCFVLYHALLSMPVVPSLLGLEPQGLKILLGIMSPLLQGASRQDPV